MVFFEGVQAPMRSHNTSSNKGENESCNTYIRKWLITPCYTATHFGILNVFCEISTFDGGKKIAPRKSPRQTFSCDRSYHIRALSSDGVSLFQQSAPMDNKDYAFHNSFAAANDHLGIFPEGMHSVLTFS
jgi:hypothetical protein